MRTNRLQKNKVVIVIVVFGVFFTSRLSHSQTWIQMQDQLKDNTQQIRNIEDKIVDLKDNYRLLYDGAKNQNDQLGNLISYWGYILAISGLFLSLYINRQNQKIKEAKNIVENTKKYIDEHNEELYKKIKRDETLGLLTRLKEVPEDIENICPLLLSRDLLEEDFLCIKEPYLKIKDDQFNQMGANDYIVLLMQHFLYQSLEDSDLKKEIVSNINILKLSGMFGRDIKNFFGEMFRYLNKFGISDENNKEIIKKSFYNYYSTPKFKGNTEIESYIRGLFTKYKINKKEALEIAKEQSPNNQPYSNWLDSFLVNGN